jgi:hypothetical protein
MKTQVGSLAIALAMVVPIAVAATAKLSAAPINGTSVTAAVPAVAADVRYRVRRGPPYRPYWGYPTYGSYWSYPTYNSYWGYPAYRSYWGYPTYHGAYGYGYYRSGCAPGPRVGAFATAPWTDAPTCPQYR